MIKLIACDLDGTLLCDHKGISEFNLSAIKEAISNNVKFIISTGREYHSVKNIMDENNLHVDAILMNGAQVSDRNGEIILEIPIPFEKAKAICDIFVKYNCAYTSFVDDAIITQLDPEEYLANSVKHFVISGHAYSEVEAIEKINEFGFARNIKQVVNTDELINYQILKIENQNTNNEEETLKMLEELKQIAGINLCVFPTGNVEITIHDATKGKTLAWYIEEMGLQHDEVLVLGDSENDVSMFEMFKNSYAMSNGNDFVKASAREVVANEDSNGVGRIINRECN